MWLLAIQCSWENPNKSLAIFPCFWQTGSGKHCTLKSQLLLVNLFILTPISDLESLFLLGISYIRSILYTVHSTFFKEPSQEPTFLCHLKNSAHMLSRSLSTVFQVANNRLTSTIDKRFNLNQKVSIFESSSNNIYTV